jgi:hypothetical protein
MESVKEYLIRLSDQEKAKEQELADKLNQIRERIKAIELTLAIQDETPIKEAFCKTLEQWPTADDLKKNCSTIPQALNYLGQKVGIVYYMRARDLILAAELSKATPKNLSIHLFNTLRVDPNWKKVGPGRFKLKEPQSKIIFSK